MDDPVKIQPPLTDDIIEKLKAGDRVVISGVIYTARDMAHKYMVEGHKKGEPLPFDVKGQILYYTGPTPAPPGKPIGSAGPTTSYRLDKYTPYLIELGLKGMIGKGPRGQEVKDAIKKHKAVYFAAIGGAGALISKTIRKADVIAYPDLGTEAIMKLEVEDFPAVVVNDVYGEDLYRIGVEQYNEAVGVEDESC
ncbi:MAG TPA: Fe-S-containing hydro-lyase [Nitrospirota bacterium]|nr:Fe-S-containing hydro-lyase [Nitrospirota bacterium]